MMTSGFIIDVSEADFEYQVLTYSQQTPVVVDFWAEWCVPCHTLGPLLESLAQEAQGEFRLAKVNVDENPNLALRYAVRSIPAVKAFRNREVISEFVGVRPEPLLREFLRSIAPSQSDLMLEKGSSLLDMLRATEAEQVFRQVRASDPESTAAMVGLAKSLLLQGRGGESHAILTDFPPSREYSSAEVLYPLAKSLATIERLPSLESDNALEAAFHNALRLVKRDNIEAAMDGLLDILREDKHFKDDEARRVMVALLELLGTRNSLTQQYRNELASILF